jgi:hypothetical protein
LSPIEGRSTRDSAAAHAMTKEQKQQLDDLREKLRELRGYL